MSDGEADEVRALRRTVDALSQKLENRTEEPVRAARGPIRDPAPAAPTPGRPGSDRSDGDGRPVLRSRRRQAARDRAAERERSRSPRRGPDVSAEEFVKSLSDEEISPLVLNGDDYGGYGEVEVLKKMPESIGIRDARRAAREERDRRDRRRQRVESQRAQAVADGGQSSRGGIRKKMIGAGILGGLALLSKRGGGE